MMSQSFLVEAKRREIRDYQSLWAGQGVGGITKEETAASIVYDLIATNLIDFFQKLFINSNITYFIISLVCQLGM